MRRRKAGQRLAQYNSELESYRRPESAPQTQQYSNYEPSRRDYNTSSDMGSNEGSYSIMPIDERKEQKRQAHHDFVRKYGKYKPSREMGRRAQPVSTPASDMTMSGSQDVDDSAMKQADFIGNFGGFNRVSQQDYANTSSIANNAIKRAEERSVIDLGALDKRIKEREMYSRAKSDKMGLDLFGDMYKYSAPDYQQPEPEKPVETPDFEKLYDKYKDDID